MEDPNIADSDPVAHKVQVNLHMLRSLMLNGVGEEIQGADIVAVDEHALGERAMELSQELSKPGRLRHAVSDSTVLRLGTGAGEPAAAWTIRRQGCRPGRRHSRKWSGECTDS